MDDGRNRGEVREWLEDLLEIPMVFLSFVMLALLLIELLVSLPPGTSRAFSMAQWVIWLIFVIHFIVTFSLAPRKSAYLRRNFLIIISLVIPFARVFYLVRALRAVRVLRTARLVTLTNRSLRQLGLVLQARRIIFVAVSSLIVIFASSIGMFILERTVPESPIRTYGTALWWASAGVMNANIDIAPVSAEGRFLAILVHLYGFAVFGVVTAALASWFTQSDRRQEEKRRVSEREESARITDKIRKDLADQPASEADLRARIDRIIALLEERERAERQAEEEP